MDRAVRDASAHVDRGGVVALPDAAHYGGGSMLALLIYAFLAGLATVLSPCILPILPVVLGAGLGGDQRRPLGVVIGLVLSFAVGTLAITALVRALHLPADVLRNVGIGLVAL